MDSGIPLTVVTYYVFIGSHAFAMFAHINFMGARGALTTLYRTLFTMLLLLTLYGSTMSFLIFCGSPMHYRMAGNFRGIVEGPSSKT